jgi:ubiquinone biosynthesis protein COQ9
MNHPFPLQCRLDYGAYIFFPKGNCAALPNTMSDLIKFVRTYRVTAGLAERLRLAETIIRQIAPDLRLYVFSRISHEAAEDALQEVLKAVATGMRKFAGGTGTEFWRWCYRIARNKVMTSGKAGGLT